MMRLKWIYQVPTITMAYVSDCALPVNSDALLLVNGTGKITQDLSIDANINDRVEKYRGIRLPLRRCTMGNGSRLCKLLRYSGRHFCSDHSPRRSISDNIWCSTSPCYRSVANHSLDGRNSIMIELDFISLARSG